MKKVFFGFLVLSCAFSGCATAPGKCLLANCPENGHVVYQYQDGTVYDGPVLNGLAWGRGKVTDKDGNVFEGEFVRGALSGPVRMKTQSGAVYNFIYSDNVPYGEYSMMLPGNVVHVLPGKVKSYVPTGVKLGGVAYVKEIVLKSVEWDDGRKYVGSFDGLTGKRLNGTTTYADGSTACGQWNDTASVILYTPEQFNAIRPTGSCEK